MRATGISVGNNIPVFFIQDAMKFPDLVHAAKPEPHFAMPQAAIRPRHVLGLRVTDAEITHMLMWAMSDRAIPRSYRTMQGFGVHTYRFVNANGESQFVKFTGAESRHPLARVGRSRQDFRRRFRLPSP
jgi:catalase